MASSSEAELYDVEELVKIWRDVRTATTMLCDFFDVLRPRLKNFGYAGYLGYAEALLAEKAQDEEHAS
jgi:hypothetical protein